MHVPIRSVTSHAALTLLVAAGLGTGGCQVISASITSPSDWVAGSSQSISGSMKGSSTASGSPSGGDGSELSAWEEDVRVYAAVAAREGRDPEAFLRGLGLLGARHGVVHVQAEPGTRTAARAGLVDAGLAGPEAERFLDRAGLADDATPATPAAGTGR